MSCPHIRRLRIHTRLQLVLPAPGGHRFVGLAGGAAVAVDGAMPLRQEFELLMCSWL
ncbi:MAG: hypothetical protein R3E95_12745 [Thiolinea sp.]